MCKQTLNGQLAPGDEGENYLYNPGEAWAEAYARLVFPEMAWRFTPRLKPTAGSLLAAAADVTQPWAKRVSTVFTGARTRTFTLPITLDGAFTLQLSGPARANYDIVVRSGGKARGEDEADGLPGSHPLPDRMPGPPHGDPEDHRTEAVRRRAVHADGEVRGLAPGPGRTNKRSVLVAWPEATKPPRRKSGSASVLGETTRRA